MDSPINLSILPDFKEGLSYLKKANKSTYLAFFVIISVLALIVPLPGWMLDFGMAINIVLALATLLLSIYVKRAIDLDIFPTLLLITTIFGLGLNFSSTRLILSKGANFDGEIVKLFSSFVTGSEGTLGLVIGFIMFAILMFVQLAVITKGATRSAEVRARFKLDSMAPEKMDLQADYQNGLISEDEYKQKTADLKKSIDLFGGLDGASKFVSGNVKLGIFITVVNIVGGLIVGTVIHGESFSSALTNYISFAIGDGLVSQLPALLVSIASGIIITKGETELSVAEVAIKQFSVNSSMYYIIAALLILMSFINFKSLFFLNFVAAGIIYAGYKISKIKKEEDSLTADKKDGMVKGANGSDEKETLRPLEPISIEFGLGLVPLGNQEKENNLVTRIKNLRRELGTELGFLFPHVRVKDNVSLNTNEYVIKIWGNSYGRGILKFGSLIAIPTEETTEDIIGEKTVEPIFGLNAFWISEDQRFEAEGKKYAIVDCPTTIVAHLSEVIKANAQELLTKELVSELLEPLKKNQNALIEEMNGKHISNSVVQKVLKGLSREAISIRNISLIMESIIDYYDIFGNNIEALIERVRIQLKNQISEKYKDENDVINCMILDSEFQNYLMEKLDGSTSNSLVYAMPKDILSGFMNAVSTSVQDVTQIGYQPIIVVASELRRPLKNFLEKDLNIPILSVEEISDHVKINVLSTIEIKNIPTKEEVEEDFDE